MTWKRSSPQDEVRRAFGDPKQSILVHGRMMETFNIEVRKSGCLRNRALVLAASVGLCATAFCCGLAAGRPARLLRVSAPAASSAGSTMRSLGQLLFRSLAGGLSLAFVATTSFKLERDIYDLEFRREVWEIENHLSGELQEMITIYKGLGLTEEEAFIVTRIFAKQTKLFAELMMVEELGYSRLVPPMFSEAVVNVGIPTLLGYAVGFSTPMLSLFLPLALEQGKGTEELRCGSSLTRLGRALLGSIGELTLAAGCVVMGTLHSEVFFGAYSNVKIRMKLIAVSLAGTGGIYALGLFAARSL